MRRRFASKLAILATIMLAVTLTGSEMSSASVDRHANTAVTATGSSFWPYKGVSIVASSPQSYSSQSFKDSVDEAVSDGANTIDLVLQYYQASLHSSGIFAAPSFPTPTALRSAISYIRASGLKVAIKVFFDVQPPKGSYASPWRYYIDPTDKSAWFRNATQIEVRLGRMRPDLLVVGTEMGGVTSQLKDRRNGFYWRKLIKAVRKVDPGQLTYEAQTPNSGKYSEASNIDFWGSLDYMSFSAYNALGATCDDSSIKSLTGYWAEADRALYKPLENRFHKKILLGEVGYSSYRCDHLTPYNYFGSSPASGLDFAEQQRDYSALFRYWTNNPAVVGALIWNWQPSAIAGGAGDTDFTPQNKPAEAVIRSAFSSKIPPVNVWWPVSSFSYTHDDRFSLQPFQSTLGALPLHDYEMFWSVNGGVENIMRDGQAADGTPEKEADVDIHGWTWNTDNVYPITFTAKTLGGQTIASAQVAITIAS